MASDLRCGIGASELAAVRCGDRGARWSLYSGTAGYLPWIHKRFIPTSTVVVIDLHNTTTTIVLEYRVDIFKMSPSKSLPFKEDAGAFTLDYAQSLDAEDPLRHLRDEFHIPTKADLKRKKLEPDG